MSGLRLSWFRWIWGLLPLLLIGWWVNTSERARIQFELAERANDALKRAGHDWAVVSFDGRNGLLSGTARSEAQRAAAMALVRGLPGVRELQGRTEVLQTIKPYVWRAIKDNGKVALRGYVPTEAARKTILSRVRATLPNASISDKAELAAGEPPQDGWISAIGFALKQLSLLQKGVVELKDMSLSVSGHATTPDAYAELHEALAQNLPVGVKAGSVKVTAPVVKPYKFAAVANGKQLVLSGYVPSETVRARLQQQAEQQFSELTVVNNVKIASGAPQGFEKAAAAGLAKLKSLQGGAVRFNDAQVTLSGQAAHQPAAKHAVASLKSALPKSYRLTDKTTWQIVEPYSWKAVRGDGELVLSGHMPDEAVRKAVKDKAVGLFSGVRVVDEMRIGTGKIAAPAWQGAVIYALDTLAKLREGAVELRNKAMSIRGGFADFATYEAVKGGLQAGLPQGFRWAEVKFEAPPRPEPDPEVSTDMPPEAGATPPAAGAQSQAPSAAGTGENRP